VQNASNKDPASFGRQGTEAEQRWHQPRRKRNGALRGVCPLYSYGAVETVFRTRVLHDIKSSSPERLSIRKEGQGRRHAANPQGPAASTR
jgi:hypothetical protein